MATKGITDVTITDGTTHVSDRNAYSAWKETIVEGGQVTLKSGNVGPAGTTTDIVVSPAIPGDLLNNRKVLTSLEIVDEGANVTSDNGIQGSLDGKNWTLVTELSTDVTPDTAGVTIVALDLSDKYYNWYRFIWNDAGENPTTASWKWAIGGLKSGVNSPLNGVGGVGADPS